MKMKKKKITKKVDKILEKIGGCLDELFESKLLNKKAAINGCGVVTLDEDNDPVLEIILRLPIGK